jgi:hypothetical protein
MRRILPYLIILFAFGALLFIKHPQVFSNNFNQKLVTDYLRSQDIEDPQGKIKDRITVSDSIIYQATGYLYATGTNPTIYNFQHPPLIKYLYGYSIILTRNPYWMQIIFGFLLLCLTYFLGTKLFKNKWISLIPVGLLLLDPVFGGMMDETLLDLGQAVFALAYAILAFFSPENFILQGIILGLFAASKFWSTAIIFAVLIFGYQIFIQRKKLNFGKLFLSFVIAFLVICLIYRTFNIIPIQARILKFMLSHNSAKIIGGPLFLFTTGFFSPWWKVGVERAKEWSILWPVGLGVGILAAFREKFKNTDFFFFLLPFIYLLLISTQVPFTRYFILILPFVYLSLTNFLIGSGEKGFKINK